MRFATLAVRNFREIVRDRMGVGFLLGFPIAFMVIMGLVFGGSSYSPIEIGVVDEDVTPASQAFLNVMEKVPALKVELFKDRTKAEEALRGGEVAGMVVIPQGFGQAASRFLSNGQGKIPLVLSYDPGDIQVAARLEPILTSLGLAFFNIKPPVSLKVEPVERRVEKPVLNWIASGMIVFGLMILISTSARLLVTDRERKWLARVLTAPITTADLLLGYSLPLVFLCLFLPPLYLAVGFAMGVRIAGNPLTVLAVLWLTGFLSIGIGMVIASLSRSHEQAEGLAWLFIVPLAMVSGVWFPVETMPRYMKYFADLLPFGHAAEAVRVVMNRGAGLNAAGGDFTVVLIWTVVLFLLGGLLFRRLLTRAI